MPLSIGTVFVAQKVEKQTIITMKHLTTKHEVARCLLCVDSPCNKACPYGKHPSHALRAIRFENPWGAADVFDEACLQCDAPCEKACLQPDYPIRIHDIACDFHKWLDEKRAVYADRIPSPEQRVSPSLEIDFCGVRCENPFFLASSAVCTNYDMVAHAFRMGWGGVVFKTIGMSEIHEVSPRFDTSCQEGFRFSGFRNMEQISENRYQEDIETLRRLKQDFPTKVIVASIMGSNDDEWTYLAKHVEAAGCDIIEMNLSCPQMTYEGMGSDVGQNCDLVEHYTSVVRAAVRIPVLAKMTPNITHIVEPAMAAMRGGSTGIAAINTIKSVTMSPHAMVSGRRTVSGYSGDAVKPIALRHIYEMTSDSRLSGQQFSGIGGITTWRDALDFITLGCRNVQICTAVMQYGYRIIEELTHGLLQYMALRGIEHLDDLVGSELNTFCPASELDRSHVIFPIFDRDECVGCGRCYLACSDAGHQALTFGEDRRPKLNGQRCVGCHLCRLVCPQQAIHAAKPIVKKG